MTSADTASEPIDHKALLKKYIDYVGQAEGTDFILIHDNRYRCDVQFTAEEWAELQRLAQQIKTRRRQDAADYSETGTEDLE